MLKTKCHKQYPGVGKTTVAFALAKAMGYCLICKDDVREAALRHDARVMSDLRTVCENDGDKLSRVRVDSNDMTYEAMFAVGLTQMRVGAKGVVLESPLGRVNLGERALAITREAQALCILVDCYAERSVWEQRLAERRLNRHGTFKPSNADQIEGHYADIHYKIDCDAHVRINCGFTPEHNVRVIERVIQQLLAEES